MPPKFFLLLLFSSAAFPQRLLVGAKGGIPLTTGFSGGIDYHTVYSPIVRRYVFGPTVDIGLSRNVRLDLDVLYRRTGWDSFGRLVDQLEPFQSTVRIGAWDFGALPKRVLRNNSGLRPYAGAGVTFRRFFTTRQVFHQFGNPRLDISKQKVAELRRKNVAGLAFAAGFEAGRTVRVAPEFRYTRWLMNNVHDAFVGIHTQANQAEFLVSFTFRP